MSQGGSFDNLRVNSTQGVGFFRLFNEQLLSQPPGDLGHFQSVGQPVMERVPFLSRNDLGYPSQTPESRCVNYPVSIRLKRSPLICRPVVRVKTFITWKRCHVICLTAASAPTSSGKTNSRSGVKIMVPLPISNHTASRRSIIPYARHIVLYALQQCSHFDWPAFFPETGLDLLQSFLKSTINHNFCLLSVC